MSWQTKLRPNRKLHLLMIIAKAFSKWTPACFRYWFYLRFLIINSHQHISSTKHQLHTHTHVNVRLSGFNNIFLPIVRPGLIKPNPGGLTGLDTCLWFNVNPLPRVCHAGSMRPGRRQKFNCLHFLLPPLNRWPVGTGRSMAIIRPLPGATQLLLNDRKAGQQASSTGDIYRTNISVSDYCKRTRQRDIFDGRAEDTTERCVEGTGKTQSRNAWA